MRTYLRGKAAGKQNFGYVKCTTKKDKQKKINKKASIHKVKFLMNTRYGADVHNQPKIHIENPAESSHISPYSCLHCASLI